MNYLRIQLDLVPLDRLNPTSIGTGDHKGDFMVLSTHRNVLVPRIQLKASELL